MQSKKEDPNRPKNLTVAKAAKYIYKNNGLKGLYRGVTPRIGLGVWQTVCMVGLGDMYAPLTHCFVSINPNISNTQGKGSCCEAYRRSSDWEALNGYQQVSLFLSWDTI